MLEATVREWETITIGDDEYSKNDLFDFSWQGLRWLWVGVCLARRSAATIRAILTEVQHLERAAAHSS